MFIKNLEEVRESYIKSAGKKVLLNEETSIMEEIISSWCSYQNIEQLQNPWERRSFFHRTYETRIFFCIWKYNLKEGDYNVKHNQFIIFKSRNGSR